MAFKKATKYQARLRMALAGPSGSGKTWTALTLAKALAGGKPVAVLDTERGSASKYADQFDFDVMELTSFHPRQYIAAIHEAEEAGYGVLVIDSLSHAWNGTGGVLELVEKTAKAAKSGSSFNAWASVTPVQNALVDAIVGASLHVIVTMRSKTEYVIESNNGKSVPRKVGMAPVQRADLEYEFDIYGEMTPDNDLIIQKSRYSGFASQQIIEKPGVDVATHLATWLEGTPAPVAEPEPPTLNESYKRGVDTGAWVKETFYATASKALGVPVTREARLSIEQLKSIAGLAEAGAVQLEAATV